MSNPLDHVWPEDAPSGAALLDELHTALVRYVVFPSTEAADAVTLWVSASHAQPAWAHAPRLAINSPEKRCGKSRLLDVVEATCHRPLITVNASVAALYRSIGSDDPPTLIVDEADAIFGTKRAAEQHEDLRALLNAGHQRNRPALRWDAKARELEQCPTFAMAAIAGIGTLPDTITDRAINLTMRRRMQGETVAQYRHRRDTPALNDLGDRLAGWLRAHLDDLENAEPDMPVEDRAADTYEPLVAVADLAGGHWPGRARKAAEVLTAEDDEDATEASLSMRLLSDLRAVFDGRTTVHTSTALELLRDIEDGPWANYFGRQMTPNDVAKLLKPYGIKSRNVKLDGVVRKGYYVDDLYDAWTRYLPTPDSAATAATAATPQVSTVAADSEVAPSAATSPEGATYLTREDTPVAPVAAQRERQPSCSACGEPLRVVEAGQTTHPGCDQEADQP